MHVHVGHHIVFSKARTRSLESWPQAMKLEDDRGSEDDVAGGNNRKPFWFDDLILAGRWMSKPCQWQRGRTG